VEASAGERTTEKTTAAEIDVGGRTSTGSDGEPDWGARDPVDSTGYTREPQARRRSEGERLGGITDDGGARAAPMARRPVLQFGGEGGEGTGRRGSLGLCEGGVRRCPGSLI
jgi:hypothetical protein